MQEHPDEPRFWMTGACCKHYAGNSVEHSTETGVTWTRDSMSVNISRRDLMGAHTSGKTGIRLHKLNVPFMLVPSVSW